MEKNGIISGKNTEKVSFPDESKSIIQKIKLPDFQGPHPQLFLKREDLIHPALSGNKWRKLKYNLEEAKERGILKLLTFGGSYSNHIYAVANAGKLYGFETIGIIRGEEHLPLNPTLKFAVENGMRLYYLDRKSYRRKKEKEVINDLKRKFGEFYLIPEGGSNILAVKGCSEIVRNIEEEYDIICSPCGTGGTLAGLICGLKGKGEVIGFAVLKGAGFLYDDISVLISKYTTQQYDNWSVNLDYHFGGYAKINIELITYIEKFEKLNDIKLDPVYTGKMIYGIADLLNKDLLDPDKKILALHTGGLQGNFGMEPKINQLKEKNKNYPDI